MLLEISGEITPERMKGWSQSKNNTKLWICLVIEARSDVVKSSGCALLEQPRKSYPTPKVRETQVRW